MSFSEWREVRLGDVCTYASTKVSVSEVSEDNYISTENMLPNKSGVTKSSGLPTVGSVTKYSAGNVLVSNIRPYFRKIWYADRDGGCSNDVLVFDINDSKTLDSKFLFYCLSNDVFFDYVMAGSKGTKMPRGDKGAIMKYPVLLPSLPEQKAIAATLSALDDMIELNNQINKTLEEMAQAIFKSWFVDFEPFKDGEFEESELGLIPKGWRVGCIGDYVKVKSGFAFKSSWWETSGVPVIKIKEIDNYTINFGDVSYVSEDKAALAKDFRVNGGDLLIAMTGATIGKFAIVPKMPSFAVVNQRVGKFFLGDNPLEKLGFIYCILKQDNVYKEIVSRGEGSAQPNISPSGIESIKIVLPPERLINEYNQLVMKFFKMIIENTAENALLICLRDTLLPKLMSGEIRVPVEEVV